MADYILKPHSETKIQDLIDMAFAAGGGRIVLEPGVHQSGTIYLKSNVELHLEAGAILRGHTSPDLYDDFRDPGFDGCAPERSRKCLVAAKFAENISITGPGEIDGCGPAFYDTEHEVGRFWSKPPHPRPRMIQFYKCKNVHLQNTTFKDSPGWTMWLIECEDVTIDSIRVIGNQMMINNDGIDIDSCRRVAVTNSLFRTGDDCLILRAIRKYADHHPVCEDITVSNCVLDSRCQGIRIGCPSDECIRNATFTNIAFHGEGNGININNPQRYLSAGDQGRLHLSNLLFSHFVITSNRVPIWINVEKGVKLRHIGDITFSDFRITSDNPIRLEGCPETTITDITLDNIVIQTPAPLPIVTEYVDRLTINNLKTKFQQP